MTENARHFEVRLAETADDLLSSQHLRYNVFAAELGASGPTVNHRLKIESDAFDDFYDHLVLVDRRRDPQNLDHVVGVYRLLQGHVAAANKGFYSATEFNLDPLLSTGRNILELGRSCVAKECRGGVSMYHLWNGLAAYVLSNDIEILFGVASYHGTNTESIAQSLSYLHKYHLAPTHTRVTVKPAFSQRMDLIDPTLVDKRVAMSQTPALIKAYLRLGGTIGDGVFIDRNFNTIDVCLMMDTKAMSARHRANYTKRKIGNAQ